MKNSFLMLTGLLFCLSGRAQNTFPSSGNVGIGTLTPAVQLDVQGSISLLNNSYLTWGGIYGWGIPTISGSSGFGSSSGLAFYPAGSTLPSAMRITSDGIIGIGSSAPAIGGEKLRVGGDMSIASGYRLILANPNNTNGGAITVTSTSGINTADLNIYGGGGAGTGIYIKNTGEVGIGTNTPSEMLAVNGKIRAKEVKVETSGWPDYVFKPSYNNMPLAELEKFIQQNNHLPEIPSALEAETNGIELGEMNKLLLKKIEELTLHLIQQGKEIEDLKKKINKE